MIDQALKREQFCKEQGSHNKERLRIDDNNSNVVVRSSFLMQIFLIILNYVAKFSIQSFPSAKKKNKRKTTPQKHTHKHTHTHK